MNYSQVYSKFNAIKDTFPYEKFLLEIELEKVNECKQKVSRLRDREIESWLNT